MYPGALLAQEACSYQGATELLARVGGRFVVLIHSDRDCSNVLPKTGQRIRQDLPYKFLCTNMREDELVTGQGNAKLRKAIELVAQDLQPDLIAVLSTCPTVMIGDNLKNVSKKAGRDLGVRVVSEATHGLRPVSPAEVVDVVFTLLASGGAVGEDDRTGRVVLAGMDLAEPEQQEIADGLQALGLTLHAVLSGRSHLQDFLAAASGATLVLPGPNMLIGLQKLAREQWQQQVVEVPLPVGVTASTAFWTRIAEATGTVDKLAAWLAQESTPALAAVQAFAAKHQGTALRCAYNIGSVRSFDLRRIALEELGELPLWQELGFACDLFIQGPQGEDNSTRTAQVLRELGYDPPFVLFPTPAHLQQFIVPGQYQLFFGADFLFDQTSRLSLPLLPHRAIQLGLRVVAGNVAAIESAMTTAFYRTFVQTVSGTQGDVVETQLRRPSDYPQLLPVLQPNAGSVVQPAHQPTNRP